MAKSNLVWKISTAVSAVIVLTLAIMLWRGITPPEPPLPPPDPGTVKMKPIKGDRVERVVSRNSDAVFKMTGKGSDANWGFRKSVNFQYVVAFKSESKVLSNTVNKETGEIKVEEMRTFTSFIDKVDVSDVDIKLDLDSLGFGKIKQVVTLLAAAADALIPHKTGGKAKPLVEGGVQVIQGLDGTSIRKGAEELAQLHGIAIPPVVDEYLNGLASKKLREVLRAKRSIEGKSYKFTYWQRSTGVPLYVKFTYADGSEVTDEEERMVLRRANAFIDSAITPSEIDTSVGAKWVVDVREFQEMFDPFADGEYMGDVMVERRDNDDEGNWLIGFQPATLRTVGDDGTETGRIQLERGSVHLDPNTRAVLNVVGSGTAVAKRTSKHHLLFTARIEGACRFEGRLVSEPKE